MASSVAIWHWRGFDFARQIERKEEKDKDQEYQSRLEKLLEETGGMKDSFGKELRHYGWNKMLKIPKFLFFFCLSKIFTIFSPTLSEQTP